MAGTNEREEDSKNTSLLSLVLFILIGGFIAIQSYGLSRIAFVMSGNMSSFCNIVPDSVSCPHNASQESKGLNDNIVVFYAYMSNGESHPGTHQILVFDVVKTNVGLAFNDHSGMFTVQNTGVYVFSWTVVSGTHSRIYSQLVVNSDAFGAILTDSSEINDYHTVTGIVVAELNHGDVVYIRTLPTDGVTGVKRSQDDKRTRFSGWKL